MWNLLPHKTSVCMCVCMYYYCLKDDHKTDCSDHGLKLYWTLKFKKLCQAEVQPTIQKID